MNYDRAAGALPSNADDLAFWTAYGSAWGRAARAAGAALAIVGASVWSPDSPPRVLALRMRILARVLYVGGGAS